VSLDTYNIDQLDIVEAIDGKVYLVTRWSYQDEPKIREMGWLVPSVAPHEVKLGTKAQRNHGGCYDIEVVVGTSRRRTVYIDKKASIDREVPFPCPKVRKGVYTRYMWGGWQKLQRDEWVPCYPTVEGK
jgi:hypothetical protein